MRPATGTEPRSAAPRRTRDSAATAASILAAATREFATHGFGGGRVDRIAARAGVNKRMIYHYYGDKRGLYLAVLEQAYQKARTAEQKLALDALEPTEAMRRLVEYTFDSFVKERSFIKLLNDENLHKAANLKRSKRIAEMHSPLIAIVRGILQRGAEAGVFRRDADPMQTWISIAAVSYFYFSNLYTLSTIFRRDFDAPAERDARRRHVVDLILSSLRPLTREKPAR
jgi:TetR/AcrR family transcriptional regulator